MASKAKISIRLLLWWHRHIGLTVAIVAIHLAITGIFLNHTNELGLDKQFINSPTLLRWYGITLPGQLNGYQIENNWLSHWNDNIYFNDHVVAHNDYPLIGAITTSYFYALATSEEIWLLTIDGEIIEKLSSPAEKLGDIMAIGRLEGNVVIKTEQGSFKADEDLVAWQHIDTDTANDRLQWSATTQVPEQLSKILFAHGHSINWERVLLDVHSGRIATQAGTLLVDLAGAALMLLAITGFTIWFRRRNNNRN